MNQVMLPDCEKLPPIGSQDSETCFRIGIPHVNQIIEGIYLVLGSNLIGFASRLYEMVTQICLAIATEQSCYNEDGRDYRGKSSRTASRQECLPWSQQQSSIKAPDHAELIGGHNYCRNPGAVETQPWCFVAGETRPRREFCSVPKCCKSIHPLCSDQPINEED